MPVSKRLRPEFFDRSTLAVARALLGARLVRVDDGRRLSGIIVEAEAYRGEEDLACHARAGLTKRTAVMYGPPGFTYVYFTYGMHWMLNFVCEREGFPAAVLVRAIVPQEGIQVIAARRNGQPPARWTDGPAKLTRALDIDGRHHGLDLSAPGAPVFVEAGVEIPDSSVTTGPRVGLNTVPEPWFSMPWRFRLKPGLVSMPETARWNEEI